jgi:hypothetical protein
MAESKNKALVYFLIATTLIFLGLSITFIVLYSERANNSVKPDNAPKILGGYGVISNVPNSQIKIQQTCSSSGSADGQLGSSPCSFNGITNLTDAIDSCNKYTFSGNQEYGNCSGFIYNSSNSTMSIINTQYTISSASSNNTNNGDVYLKQNNA